jgi:hypothetical protein
MELKYKNLIDSQRLTITCPPNNCQLNNKLEAVRWVVQPIEDELNFLPNHLYNQKRGAQTRVMSEQLKCSSCSLSFHTSVQASTIAFHSLSPNLQQKLGYTHIAIGFIDAGCGLITEPNPITQHFEFFETDSMYWLNNFVISTQL